MQKGGVKKAFGEMRVSNVLTVGDWGVVCDGVMLFCWGCSPMVIGDLKSRSGLPCGGVSL